METIPRVVVWFQMHALISGGCGEGRHCPESSTLIWTENNGQIVADCSEVEDLEAIPPVVV